MRMEIEGHYYRAGHSYQNQLTVYCEADCIIVEIEGEGTKKYPIHRVTVSDRLGSLPYRLDFPDGSAFESAQYDKIDACFSSLPRRAVWINKMESRWLWVISAMVLIPAILIVVILYGLPAMVKPMAKMIPQEVARYLDLEVIASLDGVWFQDSTLGIREHQMLNSAWSRLGLDEQEERFTLLRRSSPAIGANAFALPGGHIIVTDELFEVLKTENRIMAVLAHEQGHVELLHGLRNILQSIGVAAILSAVVGDVGGLAELILASGPTILAQSAYSRDMETEADDFAFKRLEQLGVSAACLGVGLQMLEDSHGFGDETESDHEGIDWVGLLSSHPETKARVAAAGEGEC